MDSVQYSVKIFRKHVDRAYPQGLPPGSVILELGPGDSIASAIIAAGYSVKCTYLVDVGDYADKNLDTYRSLAKELKKMGLEAPDLSGVKSFDDILSICNAVYLTEGISSLRRLPASSIDFIWSHSVLEHIRKNEFELMLKEFMRIMKPGALASHNIDFQDHLGGSLNNLRFSEKVWESNFFASSGFYTNRIPALVMHDMFRAAGFDVIQEGFGKWPGLPISRKNLHPEFRNYRDDELINRTSHVLFKA